MFAEKKYIPTFVSKKNVYGDAVYLDEIIKNKNLNNKIVFIKNADPGYDYIFTKKIRGLVTAYGGPNSHMFIRCNEMGIPAVIGVGDKNFNKLKNSKKVFLNCLEKDIFSL
jgi:phosphoenolpyruvate-protein kinase (PTS system EI component)